LIAKQKHIVLHTAISTTPIWWPFSRTIWVSQHQKGSMLYFNEAREGVAVASTGPHGNYVHFDPYR